MTSTFFIIIIIIIYLVGSFIIYGGRLSCLFAIRGRY